MKEVLLTQEYTALVDDEDYALVARYNWHLNEYKEKHFYARTHYKLVDGRSKKIRMHNLILGIFNGQKVRHLNGNGLDNRKENLRVSNSYNQIGDIVEITLFNDDVVLIDSNDFNKVKEYTLSKDKDTTGNPYIKARKEKISVRLHRLIMDAPKGADVDHINHNTLDNRKENLRVCTHTENTQNQRKTKSYNDGPCSSQYKGVSFVKATGKWYAYITVDGKRKNLGFYKEENDAAEAYNKAALEFFGEFAKINTITTIL